MAMQNQYIATITPSVAIHVVDMVFATAKVESEMNQASKAVPSRFITFPP
jgi:hypothetical protein